MATKFYKCPICGNVIVKLADSGVVPVCCGETMVLLSAHGVDGVKEKHLPVVTRTAEGALGVKVGELPHPMTPEHHICFVAMETCGGIEVHNLDAAEPAETVFCDCGKTVKAIYEYCNLHGLWVTTEIPEK